MRKIAPTLIELGRRARNQDRSTDLRIFRKLQASSKLAELSGRLCLHLGTGPTSWFLGMSCLAYSFSVEAQMNHSVMHGAFRSLPEARDLDPTRYESLALPFQSRTWGDAHRIHHQNPSLLDLDPDTAHPLFRVHSTTRWRPWHSLNSFIGSLTTFECWAVDYDRFLKKMGRRSPSDHSEKFKLLAHFSYQYVLFPALSGDNWKFVLSATCAAAIIRNLVFTGLQTASSVGHDVSTAHATRNQKQDREQWYHFQIETSKNYHLPEFWRQIFGGLDRHIEHHLYPDLPPSRLHELSPKVKAVCQGTHVRYTEFPTFWKSLKDSFSYLHKLRRKCGLESKSNVEDGRN